MAARISLDFPNATWHYFGNDAVFRLEFESHSHNLSCFAAYVLREDKGVVLLPEEDALLQKNGDTFEPGGPSAFYRTLYRHCLYLHCVRRTVLLPVKLVSL